MLNRNSVTDALHQYNIDKHILYDKKISANAPTVIVFGGIHGNEPAGILGLKRVINRIEEDALLLKGNFYAIAGNLNALQKNIRFEKSDLNRLWTKDQIRSLNELNNHENPEKEEQRAIYNIIKNIVSNNHGPFYFIDLHTTSAETIPFITISDSLNNRKFTSNFSVPIILGIEEYLEGPLLTYINEYGHVSLGFEAGQHNDHKSIENCEAFIWLSLQIANCINKEDLDNFHLYEEIMSKSTQNYNFYEIDDLYLVNDQEDFMMIDGFENFTSITKHQVLAISNSREIKARMHGQLFMPLYQKQGREGFFIITKITKFWLQLSVIVRRMKLDNIFRILPGIRRDTTNKHVLIVNPKIAQFLTTEVFHLFGYRKKIKKGNKLYFIKRDRKIIDFD